MKLLKEINKKESGQAFILALIMLLVGGLIIAPLMGFMATGLIAGQAIEEKVAEVYAADAGIEDGIWQIITGAAGLPAVGDDPWIYSIADVNGKEVEVEVEVEGGVESFLEGLLGGDAGVHDEWAATSGVPGFLGDGIYEITVTYSGLAANKKINGVGAWLQGDYDIRYYEEGHPQEGEPVYYGDLIADYPNLDSFEVRPYGGGTAFIWEWTGADRPVFGPAPDDIKNLIFEFTPIDPPAFYFSWLVGGSMDIGVIPEDFVMEIWKITATTTDTEVIAYISRLGASYVVRVLTWEIDPPY